MVKADISQNENVPVTCKVYLTDKIYWILHFFNLSTLKYYGAVVKNSPANSGASRDMGSIPGLGKFTAL